MTTETVQRAPHLEGHKCGYRDALAQVAIHIRQEADKLSPDEVEAWNLLGRLDRFIDDLHRQNQKPPE